MKFSFIENPIPGVSIYRNALKNAGRFVAMIENSCNDPNDPLTWENAQTGSGSISEYRTSINCSLAILMDEKNLHYLCDEFRSIVMKPIDNCVEDYVIQYRLSSAISEAFQVLKYFEGTNYRAHFDTSSINPRYFSCVGILADAEEGGELEFPYFDYTFYGKQGDVIIFPANHPYTHIAHPVVKGLKYSIVNWYS